MKNILFFSLLIFGFNIYSAQAQSILQFPVNYLSNAAKAWTSVLSDFGISGEIATYVKNNQSVASVGYIDAISTLAFNTSAISLFEINHHVNQAFSVIAEPIISRRNTCVKNLPDCTQKDKRIVLSGDVFGAFADYDSDKNGSFKTRNTGFSVNAKSFITDGWEIGIGYTRSMTDTEDSNVYTDAVSNSMTLFSEYLAKNGFFMNVGLNAGHTSWTADKNFAGISNNSAYDTDFIAGQTNLGVRIQGRKISFTPQMGIKYLRVMADKYTDDAAQEFDDWWYNYLTGFAGMTLGFDFIAEGLLIRPVLTAGGSYDAISNGTDNIRVQLINASIYNIPIESPTRMALNAGAGIEVYGENFVVGASYQLDYRENYTSNTATINLKIAF